MEGEVTRCQVVLAGGPVGAGIIALVRPTSPLLLGCALTALTAAACKVELASDPSDSSGTDAAGGADAPIGIDAAPDAAPLGPWGTPQLVPGASTGGSAEDDVTLSSTALELVFAVNTNNGKDLYYMSRAALDAAWTTPAAMPFNSGSASDETPRFSADGLTLYFASARAGGGTGLDVYRVTRAAIGGAWSAPAVLTGLATTATEKWFAPCALDTTYVAILGTNVAEGTLGSAPVVSAVLSSTATETGTYLSPDCLTVYFASQRSGDTRLYRATRAARGAAWSTPVLVDDFLATVGGNQEDPWLSGDQRIFAFASDARGTKDVYISTR